MAAIGFSIITAFFAVIAIRYLIKYFKQLRLNFAFPNPGIAYPLIGHSYIFFNVPREDILQILLSYIKLDTLHRKFMSIIGTNILVWFYHPENVETILSSNVLISKSEEYVYLEPWLGTGLLLSTHEKWRHRRKLLTPAFHFKILDDSLKVFNRQAETCTNLLIKDSDNGKNILDLFPIMTRCTLDIILETAMGRQLDTQNNKDSRYANAIQTMIHVIQQRQFIPWLMNDILFKFSSLKREYDESLDILHKFTKSVIKDKREEIATHARNKTVSTGPIAFLDLLLSVRLPDGSQLSDADVQEEVDTFMFEGHDTTACALSWTLLLLGRHPEIQEKIFEEQFEIFGDDSEADVNMDDLSKMKYLEACVKEALRLFPSVPIIGRRLEQDTVIDGLAMPKGSTALVFVHMLHRNPDVWKNPEEYNPERFLEEGASRHPYAYVPFSAGPRNCIGQKFALMEEKTVLSKLIRKLKFESLDPVESVKPVIEIITRPHDGVRSRVSLRN